MPTESRRIGEGADILAPAAKIRSQLGEDEEGEREERRVWDGNREKNAQVTGESGGGGGAYGRQAGSKRWAKKKKKKTGDDGCARE